MDDDSDGDKLPDGWEVYYSQLAFENGLADNETVGVYGARGVMDPSMPDSDLDGIDEIASSFTPVPGGVGPMTINTLILNTMKAAKKKLS